jgi:hypothetical protein
MSALTYPSSVATDSMKIGKSRRATVVKSTVGGGGGGGFFASAQPPSASMAATAMHPQRASQSRLTGRGLVFNTGTPRW